MNYYQELTKRNNERIAAEAEANRIEAERKFKEKTERRAEEARLAEEERKKLPPVEGLGPVDEVQVCRNGTHFFILLKDRELGTPRAYVLRETGKGQLSYPIENGNFYNAFQAACTAYRNRISGSVIV